MHCEPGDTIYHAEVRCLSRGHMLARLFDLRDIQQFSQEKDRECKMLRDHDWLYSLAFLVDMTKHLNALNTVLHGKEKKIHNAYSAVKLFQLKLKLFRSHISVKNWVHFPTLSDLKIQFPDTTYRNESFTEVIKNPEKELINRFVDIIKMESEISLFSSPFTFHVHTAPKSLQLELIDMQCDDVMKGMFDPSNMLLF
jgi:hypothetical protein